MAGHTKEERASALVHLGAWAEKALGPEFEEAVQDLWGHLHARALELGDALPMAQGVEQAWFWFDRPLPDGRRVVERYDALGQRQDEAIGEHDREARKRSADLIPRHVYVGLAEHEGQGLVDPEGLSPVQLEADPPRQHVAGVGVIGEEPANPEVRSRPAPSRWTGRS